MGKELEMRRLFCCYSFFYYICNVHSYRQRLIRNSSSIIIKSLFPKRPSAHPFNQIHNTYILLLILTSIRMIKQNRTQSDNHPLSVQWTQHLKPTGGKVSFFGKGITCIDKLDFVSKHTLESVKEIDLSHNVITKLQNVRQFENL